MDGDRLQDGIDETLGAQEGERVGCSVGDEEVDGTGVLLADLDLEDLPWIDFEKWLDLDDCKKWDALDDALDLDDDAFAHLELREELLADEDVSDVVDRLRLALDDLEVEMKESPDVNVGIDADARTPPLLELRSIR
mgnify:CR=1 FL=1